MDSNSYNFNLNESSRNSAFIRTLTEKVFFPTLQNEGRMTVIKFDYETSIGVCSHMRQFRLEYDLTEKGDHFTVFPDCVDCVKTLELVYALKQHEALLVRFQKQVEVLEKTMSNKMDCDV